MCAFHHTRPRCRNPLIFVAANGDRPKQLDMPQYAKLVTEKKKGKKDKKDKRSKGDKKKKKGKKTKKKVVPVMMVNSSSCVCVCVCVCLRSICKG